jgi:RNA polymerase sigma-70 factor, ECF subfamily
MESQRRRRSVQMTVKGTTEDATILALREQGRLDEALACLLETYEARVYRLCRAFLRDATWAEDVAQQSLIRIWKGLAGFDGRSALSTWIYTIVRNRCNTALSSAQPSATAEAALDDVADERVLDADATDAAAVLARVVDGLPTKYRLPIVLYYFEEESVAAVAERLGCPEGTVKTNLSRARDALRVRLQSLGLGEWSLWN